MVCFDYFGALNDFIEILNRQFGDLGRCLEIIDDEILRDNWKPDEAIRIPDDLDRESYIDVCRSVLQRVLDDEMALRSGGSGS